MGNLRRHRGNTVAACATCRLRAHRNEQRMGKIAIRLFGRLEVRGPDGKHIPVVGAKLQGLMAYLALNLDMPPNRDQLMTLFWGDRFTEQARQSLRQSVWKLRKLLDYGSNEVVATFNDQVSLNSELVTTDVERFSSLVAQRKPEADLEAASLYPGAFLSNLYVREQDFQDWLLTERGRLATLACPAFERGAEYLLQKGEPDAAIALAQRLVMFDPLRESSHRLLMRIHAQQGQRAAAIQQYKNCSDILERELQVEPSPNTQKLLAEIRRAGFTGPDDLSSAPEPHLADVPGPTHGQTTVTVLPFSAQPESPETEALATMLSEELAAALSKYRWLDVKASPVAEARRLTTSDMQRIAANQLVRHAVDGSIRQLGQQLRLNVKLIGLEQGRYLWVHRYDHRGENLQDMVDDLSQTVAASIEAELVMLEGAGTRSLDESEMSAWDFYHRALSVQYEFSGETNREAQRLFERALELDPRFAAAMARLSYALVINAIYFGADPGAGLLDKALQLAREASRLDPRDAVCRFALGRVYLARGEYERSFSELHAAINLNPSMAQAHCALGDSLTYAGQMDTALPCFQEAVRLSPQDPYRWAFLNYGAMAHLFRLDFEQAARWAIESVQVPNAHFLARAVLVSALGHLGRIDEAAQALAELKRDEHEVSLEFLRRRMFYLRDQNQIGIYLDGLRKAGLR
ncbi:tetratricopeptide repeat protein [Mesorhizobium sp. M00.F.Ca.ET.216.01.1.1]|nr:tetratricopeptide repeat protein [Mesorhizobium sp. M00.F.Ca.ET.216.01.1.1]TJW03938.1 MAG: tetratricopeptide repeat protein [Mesorhizobium sp.]